MEASSKPTSAKQIRRQKHVLAMAKETAHQIGTPLTSMIGWVTLLKEKQKESTPLLEIEKDIERLNLITDRFSNQHIYVVPEQKDGFSEIFL